MTDDSNTPQGQPNKSLLQGTWIGTGILVGLALFAALLYITRRAVAENKRREKALQDYFDTLSDLTLKERLENHEQRSVIQAIARSRTLTTLRGLDGQRKGSLVQFLKQSGLIDKEQPIVSLGGANLSRAELNKADLSAADLSGTNLSRANLIKANLGRADVNHANLTRGNLIEANFSEASLIRADFSRANLIRADFSRSDLRQADFSKSNLIGANLTEANLTAADFSRANLIGARVSQEQLAAARSLKGATLPDGMKAPEDEKAEHQTSGNRDAQGEGAE
ncbi:MAG: pentapeptide repeat-containing protein [Anaerolineae bacterium]